MVRSGSADIAWWRWLPATPAWRSTMCTANQTCALLTPSEMKWATGALPGVKVAVIEGNPREAGVFTMRYLFPSGTRIEPHVHPGIEHGTVIEGAISMGIGEVFVTENLRRMPVGSFSLIPAGTPHYGL